MKLVSLLALLLAPLALACEDDHSHAVAPECEAIISACHPVDPGSGPIHECHESAEAVWTKAECVANSASCMSLCQGAAQDAGTDAPAP